MALNRIQDSLGGLEEDLLQIAIDRFGQEEWDNVISRDEISKQKVESYVKIPFKNKKYGFQRIKNGQA